MRAISICSASGSLFQLLNTARTEAGEETLAAWLQTPAAIDEIARARQAVAELAGDVDFREDARRARGRSARRQDRAR